ncbi:MAG: L-seryl-tRNA(Sec) selenium transferase [Acidobacteria bacterium]|nr:L-seryl-tRNA(Sec) selenium transferase [Acidobacteriota bacterium]
MAEAARHQEFRALPSVDELLRDGPISALLERFPRTLVVAAAREILSELRVAIAENRSEEARRRQERLAQQVADRVQAAVRPSLQPVINAAGVVLHTNLGRAPLSAAALEAIRETAGCYSNLEYDLETGSRGKRDVHAGGLLERLCGAPGVVVNNNAAALFLVLHELATDGEVIVSRGELIEIGDGFRIPDIMARSGARLREVGTTNRTRIEDYRNAITPQTRVLLRVHHSNFRIVGFTGRPALEEMVQLAQQAGLPLVEDLGSGCLLDLRPYGLEDEPMVQESLAAGVDLVTFSGDKLLGGPQAGIVVGKKEWIARIRRNPLFRALRVDKLTYAALAATLRDYLVENRTGIPILAMIEQTAEQIRTRAARLLELLQGIRGELVKGSSVVGGGSTPAMDLPTTVLALSPPKGLSATICEQRLRAGPAPVIARVEKERVLLDLRTVLPEQEKTLAEMVKLAWKAGS